MSDLKLSEAMRLGAMLKPQAIGTWFGGDGSCALQACADAAGLVSSLLPEMTPYHELREAFPILNCTFEHPEREAFFCFLMGIIYGLNDSYGWTREEIADFVETIEQQQALPTAESKPASVAETLLA